VRTYLFFRFLSIATLITYAILRNGSYSGWILDLLLYNLVALLALLSIFLSPIPDDSQGRFGIALAILLWAVGSFVSSLTSFFVIDDSYNLNLIADLCYSFFYPCALYGISRSLLHRKVSRSLEILDTLIITLGFTTIIASFLLRPAMAGLSGTRFEVFVAILYPVGDVILLISTITLTFLRSITLRSFLLLVGISTYAISDFYFLYLSEKGTYQLGTATDMGWLLGFIIIAESFWHPVNEEEKNRTFNPTIASLALLGSSTILAVSVLRPDYFPRFIIAPAFATIALSFIRMGIAINDARNMSNEQILARTDELTGLANRRRFMVDFLYFSEKSGSVLILDLDGFKPVNDAHGHDVGDQLLIQVARRFERAVPHDSLIARLGGDEFGVLVHGDDGHEVGLALRATLTYPFHIENQEFKLDVSIGVALNEPSQIASDQLLRRADVAMYEAKRSGSGVCLWREELGARGSRL
jgi:diguanylate cyclase (GGDEF)-like protein